jgi:transcriptional regulator with XRE-family HTH domain
VSSQLGTRIESPAPDCSLSVRIAAVRTAAVTLKALREESRVSLRELALRAGTSSATLSNYEQGRKEPRLSTLERIAEALGKSLELTVVPDPQAELRGRRTAAEASKDVAAAVRRLDDETAFRRCLELLDDLRDAPPAGIALLTENAAEFTGDGRYDALIAAIVEDRCVEAAVRTPRWVYEPARSINDGWYVAGLKSLEADADEETTPVFRRHGVLILANEFERA